MASKPRLQPDTATGDLREQLLAAAAEIGFRQKPLGLAVKRCADVVVSALGLILISPLLLVLTYLIRRESPGPALIKQQRLGRWGRPFTVYKLRTMVREAAKLGAGLAIEKGDARITRLGKFLRASSLDELPQFFNVLKGDMSFIGPRPLPVAYLDRFNDRQKLRLLLPQGVSGWSQVLARNDAPWPQRLERDVEYVRDWSLWFDLKIFFLTFAKVFARSGVASSEGAVLEFEPENPQTEGTSDEQ